MLACLGPVRTKADDDELAAHGGKTKSVTSKHGIRLFTFQLKQMACRFTGGSLSKRCRPACTIVSRHVSHNETPVVHPSTEILSSPQFSLKSFQMNGHTPNAQETHSEPENGFNGAQSSPKALRSLYENFSEAAAVKDDGPKSEAEDSVYTAQDNEWVAQVEPGVYITFCTAPDGFNDLKRIKFSRAMFSKHHAESWWTENCPRVRELYNVRPPSSTTDDDRFSSGYATPDTYSKSPCPSFGGTDYQLTRRKSSADARLRTESRLSDSQTSDSEALTNWWVEQDEPGVYVTIIVVPGAGKQLKRVRFSREKFTDREAAAWWEHNRQRIYAQYVFATTGLQGK